MINRKFGSNWTNNLDWLDFNVFKKFKMAENPSMAYMYRILFLRLQADLW